MWFIYIGIKSCFTDVFKLKNKNLEIATVNYILNTQLIMTNPDEDLVFDTNVIVESYFCV